MTSSFFIRDVKVHALLFVADPAFTSVFKIFNELYKIQEALKASLFYSKFLEKGASLLPFFQKIKIFSKNENNF